MADGDAHDSQAPPRDDVRDDADELTITGGDDTAPSTYATTNWIGRRLGKYQIVGLIGRGGMGLVYRAHDESLARDVALKLLPSELAHESTLRDRFLSEAKSAAQISHTNVVSIFDVGQQDETWFIAMELVTGGNVEDNAPAGGAYRPLEATRIIRDACRGLAAAHQTGLVHRDIKPSNLLRRSDGTVKVADFGLAKGYQQSQALTRTGQVVGTPYYMSPEQCQSQPVDHQSDIYSLGATYFTLLTGRRPYAEVESDLQVMYAHCHGVGLDPRQIDPGVPDACASVVLKATAKEKQQRYQSASEMLAALEAVEHQLNDSASSATIHSSPSITDPPTAGHVGGSTSRRVFLGAGVAASLGAAYAAWNFWSHGGADEDAPAPEPTFARGVTRDAITFGTTTAYSGANGDLGRNMVLGMRTCFDAVNSQGGINGRQLKLVVLDDGYEPARAIANMYELIDEHQVFGVIGNVGTPTAMVTAPYAIERRILFFAPFTGAQFLRTIPPERYVYHYRAGYADETAAIVKHFVEFRDVPADRIAVLAQNDSFGDDGFNGVTRALRSYGVRSEAVLRVNYDRNSIDISDAVDALVAREGEVQAVVMVATYKPAAHFVAQLKERGSDLLFAALSFVGSEAMSEEFQEIGAEYADGVLVTQVVPFYQSSATGVIRYRDLLHRFYPEAHPGFVSLEGFIAAQCLVEGLRRVTGDLNTENLIDTLDAIRDLDLGIGPIVNFGPSKHQVSDYVWGTVLDASAQYHPRDLSQP